MKKIVLILAGLLFVATPIGFAADILWGEITNYTSTKANKTVPISAANPMKVITAASTCTAYLNGTGTGLALSANTWYDIKVPNNITSVVFACTSSAGTTVSVVR